MRDFSIALSGLHASSAALGTAGNNIANANTTAFKSQFITFSDVYLNTLGKNGAGLEKQTGDGVKTAEIAANYTQGGIKDDSFPSHLAVDGNGFFVVSDPAKPDTIKYTRAGDFVVDKDGYFVSPEGYRLRGYATKPTDDTPTPTDIDLKVESASTADPKPSILGYSFEKDGALTLSLSDGTKEVVGYVALATFACPQGLRREGGNLYVPTDPSNVAQVRAAQSGPNGAIISGALEDSNVDLATEFTNLIVAQRSFQANSRVITTVNQTLQDLLQII